MRTVKINHWNERRKIEADIEKGKSIRIRTTDQQGEEIKEYDVTFQVGDVCEEERYNLFYFGTILKITEKTVTVEKQLEKSKRRMSIKKFCWQNFRFDFDKAKASNADTLQRI